MEPPNRYPSSNQKFKDPPGVYPLPEPPNLILHQIQQINSGKQKGGLVSFSDTDFWGSAELEMDGFLASGI